MTNISPFGKIQLIQSLIAAVGFAGYFKEPEFTPSAARKEFKRQSTIVLHESPRLGTYVSKDGNARMDARRNAYKLDAIEAAALTPKGGKRRVRLTPHVNGFHVQYKKLAVIKYLEHIAAN